MTLEEYLKCNQLTQTAFAKEIGLTVHAINRHLRRGTKFKEKSIVLKMQELGIDVEVNRPLGKRVISDFLYQEKIFIKENPIGEIYCYSLARVDEVTSYLNERKISYYMRPTDYCWIVKYDTTLRSDEA